MKTIIHLVLGLVLINQALYCQKTMELNNWTYLTDNNLVILFAKNEEGKNFLLFSLKNYYHLIENNLHENDEISDALNNNEVYFRYEEDLNGYDLEDVYLVFHESRLKTSIGDDLRSDPEFYSDYFPDEILDSETINKSPQYILFDDFHIADIIDYALSGPYELDSWLESYTVEIDKGPNFRMDSGYKKNKKWLCWELATPLPIIYDEFYYYYGIRKLPRMPSYKSSYSYYNSLKDVNKISLSEQN